MKYPNTQTAISKKVQSIKKDYMEYFRVTKYNHEKFGTSEYMDDWTSVSDVGKTFGGKALTPEVYIETENKYIYLLCEFMEENNVFSFNVCNSEIYHVEKSLDKIDSLGVWMPKGAKELIYSISKTKKIEGKKNISILARLILREILWCRLEHPRMFVHFGYDYYMYVGCNKKIDENRYTEGMYIEPFKSPYLDY